jgi:hypothetical protein
MNRRALAAQREDLKAQAILAGRLLAEMEAGKNTAPAPAAALTEGLDWVADRDDDGRRFWEPKVTYTALALTQSSVEVDPETGCWLWTGEFADDRNGPDSREYPVTAGSHQMCGIAHMWVARPFMEEHLGRVLDPMETVRATCETNAGKRRPCVAPAHHRVGSKETSQ